ncbi:MAG: response regulator [bacterium]|nr:response regulator [bacterium]MCM1374116.1 response regulator [Muribaculum sp.]
MEIGNVIKEYRALKNMTQEELGAALLVTPQAVSRWETGISYPDIAMIPEIVKVLGVSADQLLGCGSPAADGDGEQPPVLEYSELVASVQGIEGKVLNQSQIDSIFNYVPTPIPAAKTVLTVDDSNFMRMMLTDMLSHEHHRVIQAASGEEGLEMLKGETCGVPVDVCILDIKMPGMNGLEVLEVIKRDYPDLKVIMLSALCTEEIVKKALELGADSFVAKPFQASSLLERI